MNDRGSRGETGQRIMWGLREKFLGRWMCSLPSIERTTWRQESNNTLEAKTQKACALQTSRESELPGPSVYIYICQWPQANICIHHHTQYTPNKGR